MTQEIPERCVSRASATAFVFSVLLHFAGCPSTGEGFCIKCKPSDRQAIERTAALARKNVGLTKGMISMEETPISRGFRSRRPEQTPKDRVPPGQYVTTEFPVLSAGPTPQTKVADWNFVLQLDGSLLGKWSWAEFEALPQTTIKTDIHCVTKWTKLATTWQGVTFDNLLKAV